jgi:hypothetical protein
VVAPAKTPFRWGLDLVQDRTPDPLSHTPEEGREVTGSVAPGEVSGEFEFAGVDLDLCISMARRRRRAIPAAGDDDLTLHPAKRQGESPPNCSLKDLLEWSDQLLAWDAFANDPVTVDHRVQEFGVPFDLVRAETEIQPLS